jgi:hypothetical protein
MLSISTQTSKISSKDPSRYTFYSGTLSGVMFLFTPSGKQRSGVRSWSSPDVLRALLERCMSLADLET